MLLSSRTIVAACSLLLVIATGCSTERSLDRRSLEVDIATQLFAEHPGLVTDVSCPDMAEPMPGQTLSCSARLGAQSVEVMVALGGTADALTSTVALADRFVNVQQVANVLAVTFSDEIAIATTVDCGQPILVIERDQAAVCTATDASGRKRLFDVQIDDAGELRLAIR